VDQNYSNNQNDFLWSLLANPASDAHLHAYNLQRLVNDFPQSGILQALLAHSSDDKNLKQASVYFNSKSLFKLINAPATFTGVPDERIIVQNSLHSNGRFQHNDHVAEDLATNNNRAADIGGHENYFNDNSTIETEEQAQEPGQQSAIVHETESDLNKEIVNEHHLTDATPEIENITHTAEASAEDKVEKTYNTVSTYIHPVEEAHNTVSTYIHPVEEVAEDKVEEAHNTVSTYIHPVEEAAEDKVEEAHNTISTYIHSVEEVAVDKVEEANETVSSHHSSLPQEPAAVKPDAEVQREEPVEPVLSVHATGDEVKQPGKQIDEEVFDEITGIEQINTEPENNQPLATEHREDKAADAVGNAEDSDTKTNSIKQEEDKLIAGSIAASDFFTFDRAFGERKLVQAEENTTPVSSAKATEIPAANGVLKDDTENQDVSKYHDEKMPYSFMWWLDKTRKEHAGIFQPYVETGKNNNSISGKTKSGTDELQQQYYENIFHITSVEELDKNTAPYAPAKDIKLKEHVIIERFIQEEPQIKPQSSDKLDNENKAKKSSEDRDELVTETLAAIYSDQMLYHKAIAAYKKLMLEFPEKSRYFADKIEQLEKKTN
jgi:hypothetical protein